MGSLGGSMRVDVTFKYLESSQFIENVLASNLRKVQRRIKMFKKDSPIHLSIHIEKNPHKEQYFCRSHMYLPTAKVLAATEKGDNSSLAINKTFSALAKQLDKTKHRLERHLQKKNNIKIR